jgi:hypothetical protein
LQFDLAYKNLDTAEKMPDLTAAQQCKIAVLWAHLYHDHAKSIVRLWCCPVDALTCVRLFCVAESQPC